MENDLGHLQQQAINDKLGLEGERAMSAQLLDSLIKQVDLLTADEQLRLVSYAAEKARRQMPAAQTRRKWKDICGALPYPALGEDAQAWVTRTRREGDEHRERLLRRS